VLISDRTDWTTFSIHDWIVLAETSAIASRPTDGFHFQYPRLDRPR